MSPVCAMCEQKRPCGLHVSECVGICLRIGELTVQVYLTVNAWVGVL